MTRELDDDKGKAIGDHYANLQLSFFMLIYDAEPVQITVGPFQFPRLSLAQLLNN